MSLSLKVALGSLGISLAVLAVKYGASLITGSVALYSDALLRIINVATAATAIIAIPTVPVREEFHSLYRQSLDRRYCLPT